MVQYKGGLERGFPYVMYAELIEEMRGQDSEHPGLLVALWVPADIAGALAVDGGEPEEDLHLTLAYCKDADPSPVELARLITGLDVIANECPPLEAKISGLGVFQACGGEDGKHVLYASVDAPQLDSIRLRVLDQLAYANIPRSTDHGYTPHITLEYVPVEAELEGTGVESEERVLDLFNRTGSVEFKFPTLCLCRGDEKIEFPLRGLARVTAYEADLSTRGREKAAKNGHAMDDGSFPIDNISDLKRAIQAHGRAKDVAAAKRHIVSRARALGAEDLLPEEWGLKESGMTRLVAALLESAGTAGSAGITERGVITEAAGSKDGSKWSVLLIKEGTSANRVHYSETVLRKAAHLFEGKPAYADHPTKDETRNRPERSVRDVVGWYDNVRWDPERRGLAADFNVLASANWLREAMLDAYQRGKPDLFGFSINAGGMRSGKFVDGGYLLESIDSVRSTDVVTVPGAGGRVLRVLESASMDELKEALVEFQTEVLEAVRATLVEKWNTRGKHLSAAHNATISAALKAKRRGKVAAKLPG